jgi:hypothetical protein
MKKTTYFLLGVSLLFLCGAASVILENGTFTGTFTGLDNGITNSAGLTVEQRAVANGIGMTTNVDAEVVLGGSTNTETLYFTNGILEAIKAP